MRDTLVALVATLAACAPAVAPDGPAQPDPARPGPGGAPAAAAAPGAADRDQDLEARRVAAIEQAVNQTRAARHDCWARAAADDYRLEGRVVLGVRFAGHGPDAAGPSVTVLDDEPGDQVLASCLVALYEGHAWPPVFAPGTAIELPFGFHAPRYQYTVQAAHVSPRALGAHAPGGHAGGGHDAGGQAAGGHDAGGQVEARVLLDEQSTGNPALALSLLTARGDVETPLQGHARATEMLYVLEGALVLRAAGNAGASVEVAAGQAAHVPPGVPYVLRHQGQAPAAWVQILIPAGPRRQLRGQAPGDLLVGEAARALPRAGDLPLVRATPEVHEIAGGQGQVALFLEPAVTASQAAYLGVLTAAPGVRIPPHAHARETEAVLVLAGAGRMTVDGDVYPVGPMTAAQIPPGVEHAVEVTGAAPLRAVQVYTPSGPEQRFKAPWP